VTIVSIHVERLTTYELSLNSNFTRSRKSVHNYPGFGSLSRKRKSWTVSEHGT